MYVSLCKFSEDTLLYDLTSKFQPFIHCQQQFVAVCTAYLLVTHLPSYKELQTSCSKNLLRLWKDNVYHYFCCYPINVSFSEY